MGGFFGGGGGGGGAADASIAQQQADETAKQALRDRINAMFTGPEGTAQFAAQDQEIADATRGLGTAAQKKAYDAAERNLRFGAAETGNIGGSTYANERSKLGESNALVGTNIEQSVQQAINSLRASRADAQARSIAAVNAGTGEGAIQSASSGLQAAIDQARSAGRQDVVANAFNDVAYNNPGIAAPGNNNTAATIASLFNRGQSVLPKPSTTGGGTIVR